MKMLSDLSLRTKSILIMTLTGFAALFFAIAAFIGYEFFMYRSVAENEALTIARIVGLNSMASLSFRDKDAAQETLASLGQESSIAIAALYDQNGALFAQTVAPEYRSIKIDEQLDPDVSIGFSQVLNWNGSMLTIYYPVVLERSRLGTVALVTIQTALVQRLKTYLGLSGLIFALSSILAYIISLYSQRIVTTPILDLQSTMQKVAATKDYNIRAAVLSEDELGQLARRFNEMLDQIREQDRELRFHRELLEDNVRKRTEELSTANANLRTTIGELQRAKDRAEAANQAKMQFLANISHEIRTPMNGVLGIAEILDRSTLSERQRQLLGTLQQSGGDLMVIINDLLDFSKLEAGKFDLNISSFNLHALLDNCLDVFNAEARKKKLEIACIVHPEVPVHIQSDPDRIRQVLINLIGNAIKFTSSGSVVLEVSAGADTGNQGQLRLSVRDTGIGIPPQALGKIFSPFTQADETMTRSHGGTGLGLAIVSQLLNLMEGGITVASTPGQGSSFTATLPFIYPEHNEKREVAPFAGIRTATLGLSPLTRTALDNILGRYALGAHHHANVESALTEADGQDKVLFFVESRGDTDAVLEDLSRLRQGPGEKFVILITPDLDETETRTELLVDKAISKPLRQSTIQHIILDAAGLAQLNQEEIAGAFRKNIVFDARALLVEDNKVNQKVAHGALRIFGLDIDIADNGLIALNMIGQEHYDIVFMDCQMPVMDGYTASTEIRAFEALSRPGERVPIVAMTAHALAKDKLRCFQNGMDGYLAKPFTLKDLSHTLRQWLPGKMRRVENPVEEDTPEAATTSALDESILQNLRTMQSQGSPDLLQAVFTAYVSSANQLMREIGGATQSNNFDMIRQHCHTLKSSSYNVGAKDFSALAKEMEARAQERQTEELPALYADLSREHLKVLEAIARLAAE